MFFIFKLFIFMLILMLNFFIVSIKLNFIWIVFLYLFLFLYEGLFARLDNITEIYRFLKANVLAFLITLSFSFVIKINTEKLFYFFMLNIFDGVIILYILKKIFLQIVNIRFLKKKVLVVYDEEGEENIKSWFGNQNVFGYDIEKMQVDKIEKKIYKTINKKLKNKNYDAVVLSLKKTNILKVVYLIDKIQVNVRKIFIFPNIYFPFYNLKTISSFSAKNVIFSITNNLFIQSNIILKNVMDFIISLILLLISMPLMIIIYIIIKVFDKTNPVYKQQRVGKDGKMFYLYKFKTMKDISKEEFESYLNKNPQAKSEWEVFKKLKNDPRVTSIGKVLRRTSLDELPQLINVIKGEMALIGPRPYLPEEIKEMGEFFEYYKKVKPGITGLWQVSGRNELTFKERIILESWYIKNWSMEMDFMILLKTVYIVLSKRGSF